MSAETLETLKQKFAAMQQAEGEFLEALRAHMAPDPVTGRPEHGALGEVQEVTRWSLRRIKEHNNPALAERRRSQRNAAAHGQQPQPPAAQREPEPPVGAATPARPRLADKTTGERAPGSGRRKPAED
jgi:hypothetical protein